MNGIFFEDQVYDWGRFKKKLGRTPVPKLPSSYHPPPELQLQKRTNKNETCARSICNSLYISGVCTNLR